METQRHTGRRQPVTTEAESGAMYLPAKDRRQTLEARKGQGRILPYRFQREHSPDDTLISDFYPPEL